MDLESIAQTYDAFQHAHPFIGSVVQGTIVFTAADAIAQGFKDHRVDKKKLGYAAALAPLYGAGVYGLMWTGEAVGAGLAASGLDTLLGASGTLLAKSALGPNLFGNIQNAAFFYNGTAGERSGYRLSGLRDAYETLLIAARETGPAGVWSLVKDGIPAKEYRNSVIGSVTAWNVIQYANYAWTPEHLRTPVSLAGILLWVTTLSIWSIVGRKRISATADTSA